MTTPSGDAITGTIEVEWHDDELYCVRADELIKVHDEFLAKVKAGSVPAAELQGNLLRIHFANVSHTYRIGQHYPLGYVAAWKTAA